MNTFMKAGTFVMNRKTGKAYMIATDTVQSKNRRQLTGMESRRPESIQVCASSLHMLTRDEAKLCMEAERLVRGRHKKSVKDKALLRKWRALREKIVG